MRGFFWASTLFCLHIHVHRCRYYSNFLSLSKGTGKCLHPSLLVTFVPFEGTQDMFFLQKVRVRITGNKLLVVHDCVMEGEGRFDSKNDVLRNCTSHPCYCFRPRAIPCAQFCYH